MDFLQREDVKDHKIREFINSFNKFTSEFPDLREDEQTKEELMERLQILGNELWAVTQDRKEQAVKERQRVIKDGWIDSELRRLIRLSCRLMAVELEKWEALRLIILGEEAE